MYGTDISERRGGLIEIKLSPHKSSRPSAMKRDTRKLLYEPKNVVFKYLSHHYILDRSIVFIVDHNFDTPLD